MSTVQPNKPAGQHSKFYKLATGLFLVVVVAVVAKLLAWWGHPYLEKAHNRLCNSLWLNEDRVTA